MMASTRLKTSIGASLLTLLAACTGNTPSGTASGDGFIPEGNPVGGLGAKEITIPTQMKEQCRDLREKYSPLASEEYVLATEPSKPPNAYIEPAEPEVLKGFQPAMAEAAMGCLGFSFKFEFFSFDALIPALETGRADVQWRTIFHTPNRAKVMDYVTYYVSNDVALVQRGDGTGVTDVQDLCGRTVAVIVASYQDEVLRKDGPAICEGQGEAIDIQTYPSIVDVAEALKRGRVDIAALDEPSAARYTKDWAEVAFTFSNSPHAGPSVLNGRDDLLNAIYDAVKIMYEAGLQKRIFSAYNVQLDAIAMPEIRK